MRFSFFLVLLVVFIDMMGIGLVYPMFSAMLFAPESGFVAPETSDAVRGTYLGILLGVGPLTSFFSAPLMGMISDQKGRRKLLFWGLGIGIVAYLVSIVGVLIQNYFVLLLSRIILGASWGTQAVASAAIADLSRPEEKTKNFGLYNMALGIGFAVGPFFGGIFSEWGYVYPFIFSALITLVNFLLIYFFFRETLKGQKAVEVSWLTGLKNLKKAFRQPALNIIFLVAFLFAFGWSFYYEFIPVTWIGHYGFDTKMVGMLYAYGAIFYALSSGWLIRPIVARYKPRSVLFWALVVEGVYILLFLFKPSGWLLWAYLPPQQFLIALLFPTATALVSNAIDEHSQGEMLGILGSVQSMSFGVGPLLAGALLGITTLMPIIVGGIAMLLGALALGLSSHFKTRSHA